MDYCSTFLIPRLYISSVISWIPSLLPEFLSEIKIISPPSFFFLFLSLLWGHALNDCCSSIVKGSLFLHLNPYFWPYLSPLLFSHLELEEGTLFLKHTISYLCILCYFYCKTLTYSFMFYDCISLASFGKLLNLIVSQYKNLVGIKMCFEI